MSRRIVQVYYGSGKGKTSAAVGQCIRAAGLGQSVIFKGKRCRRIQLFEPPGAGY